MYTVIAIALQIYCFVLTFAYAIRAKNAALYVMSAAFGGMVMRRLMAYANKTWPHPVLEWIDSGPLPLIISVMLAAGGTLHVIEYENRRRRSQQDGC